jgi:Xaa-Pro aminopeptidase
MGPFWGREMKYGDYRPYNHTPMAEGMLTSMEPSIYIPDLGAFSINDMVLVTSHGAEVMTHYPRGLEIP